MSTQRYSSTHSHALVAATICIVFAPAASTQTEAIGSKIPDPVASEIDQCVEEVLHQAQAPSASIAIVRDGRIAYEKAFGLARLTPEVPATIDTRYGIASVSKQFTAAAILLLAKEGKLKLEDPVRQYIDGLIASDTVTIRQVLSHTSGYRDYWPQDYVPPFMTKPVSPAAILDQWVRVKPDFPAGSEFQYSNSNYTVAGQIVEKLSGQPLMQFLQERIFTPLHMTHVDEDNTKSLEAPDAAGYTRVALGPVRPAPKEAPGWLYAAGQLAMPPRDLALWNISLIERSLLSPEGYQAMFQYNLGVFVKDDSGRRMIRHDGQISGTTTENRVWPEQRTALTVMVNADWGALPAAIAERISHILFPPGGADGEALAFFTALQRGTIDRNKLTANAKSYFTPEALSDAAHGLSKIGAVRTFKRVNEGRRGGLIHRRYNIVCAGGTLLASVFTTPEGQFEQFNVEPVVR
jgi:CubicO group peptidase (beta-lactamase class C family)